MVGAAEMFVALSHRLILGDMQATVITAQHASRCDLGRLLWARSFGCTQEEPHYHEQQYQRGNNKQNLHGVIPIVCDDKKGTTKP